MQRVGGRQQLEHRTRADPRQPRRSRSWWRRPCTRAPRAARRTPGCAGAAAAPAATATPPAAASSSMSPFTPRSCGSCARAAEPRTVEHHAPRRAGPARVGRVAYRYFARRKLRGQRGKRGARLEVRLLRQSRAPRRSGRRAPARGPQWPGAASSSKHAVRRANCCSSPRSRACATISGALADACPESARATTAGLPPRARRSAHRSSPARTRARACRRRTRSSCAAAPRRARAPRPSRRARRAQARRQVLRRRRR